MNWKPAALLVLTAVWLYGMLLHAIGMRSVKNPIPRNVADVYDPDTYRKWRAYKGEKSRLALIEGTVSFAAAFLLMALDAYAAFAGLFL